MQQIEFLGVNLYSKNFYISIPQRRIDKCMSSLIQIQQSIKKHRRVHVKNIASFVGQIISMAIVIGNISQFMTRYLSIDISAAHNWHAYIQLSKNSLEQIKFWEINLLKINKRFLDKDATCTIVR